MSLAARRELLDAIRDRYACSGRIEKGVILDELVASTGYDRKHAIKLLKPPSISPSVARVARKRRRRPPTYGPDVCAAFIQLWKLSRGLCPKRLVPFLPELLEALERHQEVCLPEPIRTKILKMSTATAERILKHHRHLHDYGISTTRPGTWLRQQIPLHTFSDWQDTLPGFMEIDLVAHCGDTAAGQFVYTLTMTDVASGWTECVAIPNRGQLAVLAALETVLERLPFELRGIDSDNGSEFINQSLFAFCDQRKIKFTRGRPYKKNDQCHVEQKNANIVRPLAGYARYEGPAAVDHLNRLYRVHRLHQNFFCPSMKLLTKTRNGAAVSKIYDSPLTPMKRLIGYNNIAEAQADRLTQTYSTLNPAKLVRQIEELEHGLRTHACPNPENENKTYKHRLPTNLFGKNFK